MATISTIQTNAIIPPSGFLELVKIEFLKLKHHVCNDHIWDETSETNKYKDLWILDDSGGITGNCHWLKDRDATNGDMNKPEILPITFKKDYQIEFKATFRLKVDLTGEITVFARGYRRTNRDLLLINQKQAISGGNKDDLVPLTFIGKSKFDDIIYTPNFDLDFFYKRSSDPFEIPLKKTTFRHYVTYDKPNFTSFENLGILETPQIPEMNLQIKGADGKEYICESLLYLGCKPCSGRRKTSETSVLDTIFKQFESLNILRVRERENDKRPSTGGVDSYYLPLIDMAGMGYWRDESASNTIPTWASIHQKRDFVDGSGKAPRFNRDRVTGDPGYRSVRFLLAYGVACCGEWTEFLKHLMLTQGFDTTNLKDAAICTATAPHGYLGQSADFDNIYTSNIFTVKEAVFDFTSGVMSISGDSLGQGNPRAQPLFVDHYWFYHEGNKRFYDPSYGFTKFEIESDYKIYINDYVKSVVGNSPNPNSFSGIIPASLKTSDTYKYLKTKDQARWKGK